MFLLFGLNSKSSQDIFSAFHEVMLDPLQDEKVKSEIVRVLRFYPSNHNMNVLAESLEKTESPELIFDDSFTFLFFANGDMVQVPVSGWFWACLRIPRGLLGFLGRPVICFKSVWGLLGLVLGCLVAFWYQFSIII